MNEDIKKLKAAVETLWRKRTVLVDAKSEDLDREITSIRSAIGKLHDPGIESVSKLERAARHALGEALVAAALADTGWMPVGTKVRRENYVRYYGSSKPEPTYEYGIVEVWTSESLYPDNRATRPSLGDLVVRLLKKDGTTGLKFEDVSHSQWQKEKWTEVPPASVDPESLLK